MSDEPIKEENKEPETIELWNMAMFTPRWWKPWYSLFYIDSPQYLSFSIFDKYGLRPFFFRQKEHEDGKYIGIECCVWKGRIEAFCDCMHELQRNMLICGYSDYEEFCRKIHEEWDEEEAADE